MIKKLSTYLLSFKITNIGDEIDHKATVETMFLILFSAN